MLRLYLLAAAFGAMLHGCQGKASAPAETSAAEVPVEVVQVASEDVDVRIEAVGTLRADQSVDLKAERPGPVRELYFTEGAPARKGAVLLVLGSEDLRARLNLAKANVVDGQVREANARQQYERSVALLKRGVTSQQQHDDVRAELERASAGLAVARANVAFAEAELTKTVISAPFDGILGQRRVDIGAFVREGETLGSIVDLDPIEALFAVPERYLSQLHAEQSIDAVVVSHPERSFSGKVMFIDPQVDPVNRTVAVKAVIPNPDSLLRPGQFATVSLHLERHSNAAVIPEEALVPSGDRSFVFVVDGGQASARAVRTGVRLAGKVEVIDGLQAGTVIVRTGHEKLRLDAAQPVVEAGGSS